jgi:hypothetical protein
MHSTEPRNPVTRTGRPQRHRNDNTYRNSVSRSNFTMVLLRNWDTIHPGRVSKYSIAESQTQPILFKTWIEDKGLNLNESHIRPGVRWLPMSLKGKTVATIAQYGWRKSTNRSQKIHVTLGGEGEGHHWITDFQSDFIWHSLSSTMSDWKGQHEIDKCERTCPPRFEFQEPKAFEKDLQNGWKNGCYWRSLEPQGDISDLYFRFPFVRQLLKHEMPWNIWAQMGFGGKTTAGRTIRNHRLIPFASFHYPCKNSIGLGFSEANSRDLFFSLRS